MAADYSFPYPIYALGFSSVQPEASSSRATLPPSLKVAVGSLIETGSENYVTVLGSSFDDTSDQYDTDSSPPLKPGLVPLAKAIHQYPCTKTAFMPVQSQVAGRDMLATSSDALRLFDLEEIEDASNSSSFVGSSSKPLTTLRLSSRSTLANAKSDFQAPLTSFSWSSVDPAAILTASTNTTVTLWDITQSSAVTQLIAHDKEVYDVAWQPGHATGKDIFASCGADGSVRMFDIRSLEHSTILYEANAPLSPPTTYQTTPSTLSQPLLRLAFDPSQSSALAAIHENSNSVLLIDIRVPGIPVAEFKGHKAPVNAITWSSESSTTETGGALCTVGDDGQVLVWDGSNAFTSNAPRDDLASSTNKSRNQAGASKIVKTPILAYDAGAEVNNVSFGGSSTQGEWIGFTSGRTLRALRV